MTPPVWLAELLMVVERSPVGETVRLTPHLYPILMSVHVLGIALLVGPALAVDLRLLGLGRTVVPVTIVARYLLPLARAGFAVVALTGAAMFSGIALQVCSSAAAPWKFGLILVAGTNIAIFHAGIYRSVADWDLHAPSPPAARIAAVVSALCWSGVIFGGRFLAY